MSAQVQIKVFKVGECDWIAAENPKDALKHWQETMGYSDDDIEIDGYEAEELSPDEMTTFMHHGDDGERRNNPISFKEELENNLKEGVEFPCLFATTEY